MRFPVNESLIKAKRTPQTSKDETIELKTYKPIFENLELIGINLKSKTTRIGAKNG